MKKATKVWIILSVIVVSLGVVMSGFRWDLSKFFTTKYETNTYPVEAAFQNIEIVADTADILLVSGENANVVCYELSHIKHTVSVKGDTLTIEVVDTSARYEHIGIFFDAPKITVTLPQGAYGALSVKTDTGDVEIPKDFQFASIDVTEDTGKITCFASASGAAKMKTTTGDILVENISADDLSLFVSTGKITLSDIACKTLLSEGDSGDISLRNVIATEKFDIERDTGDVKLDGCDAGEIFIETDTGNVTGTLLSSKIFLTETDTGRIDVPKSITGGRCEISTDTGDIKLSVQQP